MPEKAPKGGEMERSDYTKIKDFCSAKYTIDKVKTQAISGEKIFPMYIIKKRLIPRIVKKLL